MLQVEANKMLKNKNTTRDGFPKENVRAAATGKMASSNNSDASSHVDPIRKHIKYGTTFQAAKGIFLEYFKDSTIHGLKYIGDQKRSTSERIVWLCSLILSIVICCCLITNIFDEYNSTPVIITFNEKQTPVWEIPFPTVTICPETKSRTNVFNYTKIYYKIKDNENLTEGEQHYWEAISQICRPKILDYGHDFANASDLISNISHAAPLRQFRMFACSWRKLQTGCVNAINDILTKEGICFSFNSLNGKYFIREEYLNVMNITGSDVLNWDLENGYSKEAGQNTTPVYAQGNGEDEQLILDLVNIKKDSEQLCRATVEGYKVILHTPGELPNVSKKFLNIPFGQSATISIKPKIVITSEGLRQYGIKGRQCYYQNERYLRYFNLYTKANCEMECLSNHTLKKCDCVKFSMPRNSTHPVCGAKKVKCLSDVEKSILSKRFEHSNECNCLATCISIQYNPELENQVPLDFSKSMSAANTDSTQISNTEKLMGVTRLTIGFKEEAFSTLKRSELYSKTDFIASCGGLLGLFMGVSILSLVELVYFCTIRLWVNLKMRRQKQQELRKFEENPYETHY